ncbi:hypothetical protein HanIR_Chr06g0299131 [Helianthus annuus]|nr:hypothetical protein HanIR_Chr06g0299131 [Helianthus annuus]
MHTSPGLLRHICLLQLLLRFSLTNAVLQLPLRYLQIQRVYKQEILCKCNQALQLSFF